MVDNANINNKIMVATINYRIKEIREKFCSGKNKNKEFAEILGETTSNTSNWIVEGYSIGMGVVSKIKQAFPNLNLNWLIVGDGKMTINSQDIHIEEDNGITGIQGSGHTITNNDTKELYNVIREKDEEIKRMHTENGNKHKERFALLKDKEQTIKEKEDIIKEKDAQISKMFDQLSKERSRIDQLTDLLNKKTITDE